MVKYKYLLLMICGVSVVAQAETTVKTQHDPTEPLGWMTPKQVVTKKATPREKVPTLQLLTCINEQPCSAVINSKMVHKGDNVSGYKVVNIDDKRVTIKKGSRTWKLELFSSDIKQ
ncbi:MSHA biogenesis protein MshK [Aliivibrio kagoshimensis]|uniref:MSHA biogenesis protein MshK n=1 Tax=Aliivibrio kagoshimensis TaxID=2910230 RepID=UPI003D136B17